MPASAWATSPTGAAAPGPPAGSTQGLLRCPCTARCVRSSRPGQLPPLNRPGAAAPGPCRALTALLLPLPPPALPRHPRVCYLLMHLALVLAVERARPSSTLALVAYACLAALGLGASFASQPVFLAIFTVVVAGELVAPFLGVVLSAARVPLHVEHVAERMGLIMMITLGECVGVVLLQAVTYNATQYVGGRLPRGAAC